MAKTVNWQQLAESGRHADMFMLIRTFSLIINCRQTRDECPDWKVNLGAEIHKYFLQVRKSFDHSTIYGAFEMMVSLVVIQTFVKSYKTIDILDRAIYCLLRYPRCYNKVSSFNVS